MGKKSTCYNTRTNLMEDSPWSSFYVNKFHLQAFTLDIYWSLNVESWHCTVSVYSELKRSAVTHNCALTFCFCIVLDYWPTYQKLLNHCISDRTSALMLVQLLLLSFFLFLMDFVVGEGGKQALNMDTWMQVKRNHKWMELFHLFCVSPVIERR